MTALQDGGPKVRYFYRDPLAAAWMAKHHGINLQVHHSYQGEDYGLLDVTALQVDALGMAIYIEATDPCGQHGDFVFGDRHGECEDIDKAFYIHPDSLPLLEPRVGDLILLESGCAATLKHKLNTRMLVLLGFTGLPYYDTLESHALQSIIHRNGIPFHWPESEAA